MPDNEISDREHKNIRKIPILETKINTILALTAGQFIAVLSLIIAILSFVFSGSDQGLIIAITSFISAL